MTDIIEMVAISILVLVGSGIGGFIARFLYDSFAYIKLEKRLQSLENAGHSELGVAARREKSERINSAIVEAAALYKEGKKPDEIIKELLPKYPDVAMQVITKLGKGKGLEGFL